MKTARADALKSSTTLEVERYRALRDRLLAEVPNIDEETLADTLEGITELREVLAELLRSALEDEALATALSLGLPT
jgi:hypothetical protein